VNFEMKNFSSAACSGSPLLSIVTPVFNESAGLPLFCKSLKLVLDAAEFTYEVIFVDDGSTDGSAEIILNENWANTRVVQLTKNVGHQVAIEAGLNHANGAYILTMDSDGQHPVEAVPAMLQAAMNADADVVYAQRLNRKGDGFAKRTSARFYYWLTSALTGIDIENGQADFRLVTSRVLQEIASVKGDKTLRLLIPAIGYRSVVVPYETLPRIAGNGRFGLHRQLKLGVGTILDFSSKPLRIVAAAGASLALLAFAWLVSVLVTYVGTRTVSGWASVMAAVLFVGGISLISLSIVGEYVARIHDLLKGHPRYSVASELVPRKD
jgi:dolichol-phosphate mannosyltransferase